MSAKEEISTPSALKVVPSFLMKFSAKVLPLASIMSKVVLPRLITVTGVLLKSAAN